MKVGDLVKFVGVANYYKNAVGVITKIYRPDRSNGTVVVYIPTLPEGRSLQQASTPCFHPFAFEEVELV